MNSSTLSLAFAKLIAFAVILLCSGTLATGQPNDQSPFPALEDLTENEMMPDPFMRPDGTRVGSRSEWKQQRVYLRSMLQHYLYGRVPPKPSAKEVSVEKLSDKAWKAPGSDVEGRKLSYRITISRKGLDHSFGFILCRPAKIKRYLGVEPDLFVDNLPHQTYLGKDAQLEAAIAYLQEKIEEEPPQVPAAPARPDKSFNYPPEEAR
jgi:hypothetical protein